MTSAQRWNRLLFGYYRAEYIQALPAWVLYFSLLLEHYATCFPLLFLGIVLVQSIYNRITKTWAQSETADGKKKICSLSKNHRDITRLSYIHRASILCSILLMLTHSSGLVLLLLNEKEKNHIYNRNVLQEVAYIIAWLVSWVMIYRSKETQALRPPLMLRTWWVLGFIHSINQMLLDVYWLFRHHKLPSLGDFMGFSDFLFCTSLLIILLKGSSRVASSSSSITDPLLTNLVEETTEHAKQSPYRNASLVELVTFSWLNPLLAIGASKPLEQNEVPELDAKDSADFLDHRFQDIWNFVKETSENPSMYKVIFLFIRKKAAINAALAVTSAVASYIGPYLIDDLVQLLSSEKQRSVSYGVLLVAAFLGAKMIETTTERQWIFGARQLGLRLRAALISVIYKKGLHLSSQAKQKHTSGELVNYISVDVQRAADFLYHLNTIWMLPIQLSLAIYILYLNLGLGCLAALLSTIIIMACNVPITKTQKRFQSKIMQCKDHRMKATTEVVRNIKALKFQAWDIKYLQKLENLRKNEYKWLLRSTYLAATSSFLFWGAPEFIAVLTFGACVWMKIPLPAGSVLTALASFRMLQLPIFTLPDLLAALAQAKVSVDRIALFLQEEEVQLDAVQVIPRNVAESDVEISGGTFSWDLQSLKPTLTEIELTVLRGQKVAICGSVGSGKSSLLSCILGDIRKISGTVKTSGSKAYVPQSPWIQSGEVRDNILFGNKLDRARYEKTIKACALEKDFELFPYHDLTEVGERGISISGGQKQRIQLARAVYQDADLYLLDDPFSAVDAETGNHLFRMCLMGILKDKTVLYVTHQLEFLRAAQVILVMSDGHITQAGSFEELLQHNFHFQALVGAHSQALESVTMAGSSASNQPVAPRPWTDLVKEAGSHTAELKGKVDAGCKKGEEKSEHEEQRERGRIRKEIYWSYLTAVRGGALVLVTLFAMILYQVLQVASNYWMVWISHEGSNRGIRSLYIVYVILSIGCSICVLSRAMLTGFLGLKTSQRLFTNMLSSIIHAPMSFFDTTPSGRILNRASSDQTTVDSYVAGKLSRCATTFIQLLGIVFVMSQEAWEIIVVLFVVTALAVWCQRYYIQTARELVRLAGIQRSPILHHFVESLSGSAVIHAFAHENRFVQTNLTFVDQHSKPWFHNLSALEWLSFRLNLLSNIVFGSSIVILILFPAGILDPSVAGLTITYGLNLNVVLSFFIWGISDAENNMVSVERIMQFSRLNSEAPWLIEERRPAINWPREGTIRFKNLNVRYAAHLPVVLKNFTCIFPGKKKIGIVGRTGSGKSTLVQVIFRIIEPTDGNITIDDVDICKLGLHDLRRKLSIVPQDPTMFQGTVRNNLDPLHQHSDSELWEVLDKCQLGDIIRTRDSKLDTSVTENGENWSMGQRQLFCLARILLKRNRILILDEATASVDSATDALMQQIISQEFEDQTVITVAHRIHTVINSDLILVLSEGQIQEYDSPDNLLKNEHSAFLKLTQEYSLKADQLHSS